jgi:hypothetical protein
VESLSWRRVRAPARIARGIAALPLGPQVMTFGPAQQTAVAFGLAGLVSGLRWSCAQAGRWSFGPVAIECLSLFRIDSNCSQS